MAMMRRAAAGAQEASAIAAETAAAMGAMAMAAAMGSSRVEAVARAEAAVAQAARNAVVIDYPIASHSQATESAAMRLPHAAWVAGPIPTLQEGSGTPPRRSTSGQPTRSSDYPLRINRRTCGKRPRSYA